MQIGKEILDFTLPTVPISGGPNNPRLDIWLYEGRTFHPMKGNRTNFRNNVDLQNQGAEISSNCVLHRHKNTLHTAYTIFI
jgi:hypothetical protein